MRRRPGSRGGAVIVADGGYYGGGFYPWGWGGLGFGGAWGGGYWDPWWPGDMPPYGYAGYLDDGSIRLKVKPREADVYVDGYYAGRVDDCDGVFQRLHVEAGPHRVEIRLGGYETLTVDVRVLPNRTLTYEGALKKRP